MSILDVLVYIYVFLKINVTYFGCLSLIVAVRKIPLKLFMRLILCFYTNSIDLDVLLRFSEVTI